MSAPEYREPEYRAAVQALKNSPTTLCWKACGRPATTIDHHPPLALHTHQRGTNCCTLHPACKPCQDRQGADIVNHRTTTDDTGYDWP